MLKSLQVFTYLVKTSNFLLPEASSSIASLPALQPARRHRNSGKAKQSSYVVHFASSFTVTPGRQGSRNSVNDNVDLLSPATSELLAAWRATRELPTVWSGLRSAWVTAYCYFRRWRATRELPAVWSGLRTALVTAYCYFRRRRVTKKLLVAYVLQFPAVENNYVKCFSGVLLLRLGLVFCFVDLIFNCLGAAAPYVHSFFFQKPLLPIASLPRSSTQARRHRNSGKAKQSSYVVSLCFFVHCDSGQGKGSSQLPSMTNVDLLSPCDE
nr:hypothetical protein Iba_chr02aCG11670 [Ipomoea batatas]